jgi:hypothetical protein
MLRSFAELEQFLAAVEAENWVEDAENTWGARGVALNDLVLERKQIMKQLIDSEMLELSPSGVADADAGVSTPSSGVRSLDESEAK